MVSTILAYGSEAFVPIFTLCGGIALVAILWVLSQYAVRQAWEASRKTILYFRDRDKFLREYRWEFL